MNDTQKIVGLATLVTVGVGTVNAFHKHNRPPSARFLVGSGIAYAVLSAVGEGEPEIAKSLALAMAGTMIIGEGNGLLSYMDNGELDTRRPKNDEAYQKTAADLYSAEPVEIADSPSPENYPNSVAVVHEHPFVLDYITPIPGI